MDERRDKNAILGVASAVVKVIGIHNRKCENTALAFHDPFLVKCNDRVIPIKFEVVTLLCTLCIWNKVRVQNKMVVISRVISFSPSSTSSCGILFGVVLVVE